MSRLPKILLLLIFASVSAPLAFAQSPCPQPELPPGAEMIAQNSLSPAQLPAEAAGALQNALPSGFRATAVWELNFSPRVYAVQIDNCCTLPSALTENRALILEPVAGGRYRALPVVEKNGNAATLVAPVLFYRRGGRLFFLSSLLARDVCHEGIGGRVGGQFVFLSTRQAGRESSLLREQMNIQPLEKFINESDGLLSSAIAGDGVTDAAAKFFEAVLRADADSFQKFFAPGEQVFRSNNPDERKKTIRLSRLLFGLEDQWEIVNDFEGRYDLEPGQGYVSDVAFSGRIGQSVFGDEMFIEFRRVGAGGVLAVLRTPEGSLPWFLVEISRTASGFVVNEVVSLNPRTKMNTPLREFLRGGGQYLEARRHYFGDAPPAAPGGVISGGGVSLPEPIRNTLDVVCPGWYFAEASNEVNAYFAQQKRGAVPYQAVGDFDGDGRRDYAVYVWQQSPGGPQRLVLAFLERGAEFEMHVLEKEAGADPKIYIELLRRGQRGFDHERQRAFNYPRDAVGVAIFEKAGVAYLFESGRFRKIIVSD
ncbi:MAG TPA: hypothetical protein VNL38_03900 [Candidatus Nitrosotenuis sp.]|nr:hypothetical protein [Candidatus Nitrosotenuis sp.]